MNKNKKHIYKPSLEYINSVHSNKQLIYKDELFTFTTDDLYFTNNSFNLTCISLDISRYFNAKHSSFHTVGNNKEKNYPFVINKSAEINMHKHKLITLLSHDISLSVNDTSFLSDKFNVDCLSASYAQCEHLKLVPGDTICPGITIRSMFEKQSKIVSLNKLQNSRLSKIKYTDRKYRSSHHNMNIKKHVHNLKTKVNLIMDKVCTTEQEKNTVQRYNDIIATSKNNIIHKNIYTYKKLKQLKYITNFACIKKPLYDIAKKICEILYNKSSHKGTMYYIKRTLYISNYKKFYKFLRMQYVLISLKRYDDAAELFIYKNYETYFYDHGNYKKIEVPDVNCTDISKKTINIYKKRFDQLYYQISKRKYTMKAVDDTDCTNINYYAVPKIKEQIANMFKSYAMLYNMQTSSSPERKRFFYLFESYDNSRLGILLIKPKFY